MGSLCAWAGHLRRIRLISHGVFGRLVPCAAEPLRKLNFLDERLLPERIVHLVVSKRRLFLTTILLGTLMLRLRLLYVSFVGLGDLRARARRVLDGALKHIRSLLAL